MVAKVLGTKIVDVVHEFVYKLELIPVLYCTDIL